MKRQIHNLAKLSLKMAKMALLMGEDQFYYLKRFSFTLSFVVRGKDNGSKRQCGYSH
jgi:hypothetical protein